MDTDDKTSSVKTLTPDDFQDVWVTCLAFQSCLPLTLPKSIDIIDLLGLGFQFGLSIKVHALETLSPEDCQGELVEA